MKVPRNSRPIAGNRRRAGILLHPTSLPGPYGIGDLGPEADSFIDFLVECQQGAWQVLPLGPAGSGNSPYQPFSAFAGNPLLISIDRLRKQGWLRPSDLNGHPAFPARKVSYKAAAAFKEPLLHIAHERFKRSASRATKSAFDSFCRANKSWLDDYALFTVLMEKLGGLSWTEWDKPIRERQARALSSCRRDLKPEIDYLKFVQFEFFRQWRLVKNRCNKNAIKIVGDIAIFVAHNSADVWAHPQMFDLSLNGIQRSMAGVPPDYFSASGQLWGNPLYRWAVLRRSGYRWWVTRLRRALELFDLLRLDHFRGFEKYWRVKAGQQTAIQGAWVRGPGADFFNTMLRRLKKFPVIAEDLGLITPEVEALRDRFSLPGMRVLQFAFGSDHEAMRYLPHNYPRNCVVYTATHDNDTTVGWFSNSSTRFSTYSTRQIKAEKERALRYIGSDGGSINWDFIRLAFNSVADLAIVPLQDILGLGSEARMNRPGTPFGNWEWRYTSSMLSRKLRRRLAELTEITQRAAGCGRKATRKPARSNSR